MKNNNENTSDSFVINISDEAAVKECMDVAENLNMNYNPLLIYGIPEARKSLLLHSVEKSIAIKHPGKNIICVSGEVIINEIIDAITKQDFQELRSKYMSSDVILVTDISFRYRGESIQKEFFNFIEYLYSGGKQIILTSEYDLDDLKNLSDLISSRFRNGNIIRIG